MNIALEKEEIIRQLNHVQDINLLKAIKSLLDFGEHKQAGDAPADEKNNPALHASIKRAISDSQKGLVRPHTEFMAEIRKSYNL